MQISKVVENVTDLSVTLQNVCTGLGIPSQAILLSGINVMSLQVDIHSSDAKTAFMSDVYEKNVYEFD